MKIIEIRLANGESVIANAKWRVLGCTGSGLGWDAPGWFRVGNHVAWPCAPVPCDGSLSIPDCVQIVRVVAVLEVEQKLESVSFREPQEAAA